MLPGLRILFAITLLSVSVVIFGLGAAAFLRSAHEDVANAPWRPIETPVTARVDLAPTTLSMLRVEPEATIAAVTARADAEAAAAAPVEAKPEVVTDAALPAAPEPRTEQVTASTGEPAVAAQAAPPPALETIVAAVEPAREQPPAVVEARVGEPRAAEAKATEAKAAATAEAQPAPTVVAALSADKVEQTPAKSAFEPVTAPQESLDVPVSAVIPAVTNAGADTLKSDDKAIQGIKVAALGEPATAESPLASKDVKIPAPRVDPAVIEARRKHQQMLVQRARARAAAASRARRVAAARARAARAAAAAAATNPFGAPANSTTNNIRTN